ncbi:MarR family transcriptional regulator [Bosea sp. CS1GBMeth4]|uniref:MarR family winged helix-turn-helix transcriptional regulator n=1 Tax=Bosea sp. CS1GBMeth4 TaxID=1892849 RepID=UPI0016488BB0|nr:MarR family transcriptional regulator [Bosea sp. CS1GBMeth4]
MNALSLPRPAPVPEPVEPDRVWFRFMRLHQRMLGQMTVRIRELGLSIPQFDLLSTLTEREGISQSELAERLYVTKGNVSGLVDRLVQAGLVERRAIVGDRRSYAMHLTPEGRRLAEAGIAAQRDYVAQTLGKLPAEDIAELDRLVLAWRERARAVDAP